MCYRSLQVNQFDPKSDLNSDFKMKLPVYDLKISWPNCHTFRCRFITMHIHGVVVYYADYLDNRQSMFLVKTSLIWFSMPTHCPSSM